MYLSSAQIQKDEGLNVHHINKILANTTLKPVKEVNDYRTTQNELKQIYHFKPTGKSALTCYCKKFTKKGQNKPGKTYKEDKKYNKKGENLSSVERKKKVQETGTIWIEESPDIFWPTIPGLDGPIEESAEPIGNLNKPPRRDPEEEEKYKNLYVPTQEEMYEQFQHWPPYKLELENDDFQDENEDE